MRYISIDEENVRAVRSLVSKTMFLFLFFVDFAVDIDVDVAVDVCVCVYLSLLFNFPYELFKSFRVIAQYCIYVFDICC